jgi:hypothetical protein
MGITILWVIILIVWIAILIIRLTPHMKDTSGNLFQIALAIFWILLATTILMTNDSLKKEKTPVEETTEVQDVSESSVIEDTIY